MIPMWVINHSVDWGQFTCDYMLLFQIVCLIIATVFFSLCFNIWYFSSRHRLHWFDGLLFVVAWLIIFLVILNFEFFFLNFQTYLESSISFSFSTVSVGRTWIYPYKLSHIIKSLRRYLSLLWTLLNDIFHFVLHYFFFGCPHLILFI